MLFFSPTRPVLKRGSYNAELTRITVHEESSPDSTRRAVAVAMAAALFWKSNRRKFGNLSMSASWARSFKGTRGFGVLPVELHRREERFNQRLKVFAA
jgi:hypothetical protein